MDAIVTARVPVAVKERANDILAEIGSTQSQLVNAAYDFLLTEHKLPAPNATKAQHAKKRKPTKAQMNKVDEALAGMFVGPIDSEIAFSEQLSAARDERYAHSA